MRKNNFSKRMMAGMLVAMMALSSAGCGNRKADITENIIGNMIDGNEPVKPDNMEQNINYQGIKEGEVYADCVEAAECGGYVPVDGYYDDGYYNEFGEPFNTNEYNDLAENSWASVTVSPLSTFAADVDTASYSQIRSNITNGYEVSPAMVRIEEMINYFHYDYEKPQGDDKFGVCTEYIDCPWNPDTKLALVSLSTEAIDFSEAPASNLVFLVDVSGSMFDSNKLPLAQQSLCMVVENLTEKDRVSIVTYAGEDKVLLEGVSGDNYYEISRVVESMEANGSTNGSAGINTAYEIAEKYFIEGGNNRVILMTDGDLNVGVTSEGDLERLITEKKKSGVFLSVMGFGYGNYKDNKMETLADKGNGNYAYIDSIYEAKKALVDDMGANFVTVAKDVKLQVEFNPAQVKGYRLIGYENRVMAAEDFADDTKDGGEMGAGHTVTALYEIALADSDFEINSPDLKYGQQDADVDYMDYGNELFTVNVRYKEVDSDTSTLDSFVCTADNYSEKGSDNIRFAAAVAAFGMYLKGSEYMGNTTLALVEKLALSANCDSDEYKQEFIQLVKAYEKV